MPDHRPPYRSRHMVPLVIIVNILIGVVSMLTDSIPAASAAERTIRIVAFGDSLTAGYGVAQSAAFPVQLEKALKAKGHNVEVINGGVSGDTTAAALERLDWSVPDKVDAAIVELGANDALRGLDPVRAHANLDKILKRLSSRGAELLVAGMAAPRNWGDAYVKAFDPMYAELARVHGALLYPFFLEGVALRADLNLGDGLHPNKAGIAEIVKRILPSVEALIAKVKAKHAASAKKG